MPLGLIRLSSAPLRSIVLSQHRSRSSGVSLRGVIEMSSRRSLWQKDHDPSPTRRRFLKRVTTAAGLLASLEPGSPLAQALFAYSGDSPMQTISAMAEASRHFLDSLNP